MGVRGSPALDAMTPFRMSQAHNTDGIQFDRYTVELQGLLNQVNCAYDARSAIIYTPTPPSIRLSYSCPDETVFLAPTPIYPQENTNTFVFYACSPGIRNETMGSAQRYSLYLSGIQGYQSVIGNITCTLSSQHAVFPVTFSPQSSIFSVQEHITSSTSLPTLLIEPSLQELERIIGDHQTLNGNLVAQSVLMAGIKSRLQPNQTSDTYLRLFEMLLQAVIDYYVCSDLIFLTRGVG